MVIALHKFSSNRHPQRLVVNDILFNGINLNEKDLEQLALSIRKYPIIFQQGLVHDRSDSIVWFYYIYDLKKKVYYNIAKNVNVKKNGKIKVTYFLYAISNSIIGKK